MTKRYKVTVTEMGEEKRIIGSDWKLGAGESNDDYGYTPEIEATCDYERVIFEQTVDELDMKAVVSAVNGGFGE